MVEFRVRVRVRISGFTVRAYGYPHTLRAF